MADLNSRATDGTLSFTKYVTNNPRWAEIEFEIEAKKSTVLHKKDYNDIMVPINNKEYSAGTKLKIINNKHKEVGVGRATQRWVEVNIKGQKGWILASVIRKPTAGNGTQYENEVVDMINNYILNAGGSIDIKIKGESTIYKGISYAVKVEAPLKRKAGVKGDPKADIILCKDIKDPLAKTSIFISHKKSGGPEAFQQYGGLSAQAGEDLANHPLTQRFLEHCASLIGDGIKLPRPVMATFSDKELMCKSIYGPDYGKKFSINHTQIIGQGLPVLVNDKDRCVILDFTSHMSRSGDLSHFKDGYLPVFGATFRAGRGFDYKGKRYQGARVAIYPQKLMAGRSGLEKISL